MKVVKSVSFDTKIMQKVDDYMIESKEHNFSRAINHLIQMGIAYNEIQKLKKFKRDESIE